MSVAGDVNAVEIDVSSVDGGTEVWVDGVDRGLRPVGFQSDDADARSSCSKVFAEVTQDTNTERDAKSRRNKGK